MVMPGMGPDLENLPKPRIIGDDELNIGDLWRARWVEGEPLPKGVPVEHVYATVLFEGKGYTWRRKGDDLWNTLEGAPEGTRPETFVRQAARARMGIEAGVIQLVGHFNCRATSHHPGVEAGSPATIPFYVVGAKRVGSNPKESGFERRRFPLNEFGQFLRRRYPELVKYLPRLLERYVVLQARGETP